MKNRKQRILTDLNKVGEADIKLHSTKNICRFPKSHSLWDIMLPKKSYALILAFILYLSLGITAVNSGSSIEVYIYDFPEFPSFKEIEKYFSGLPEIRTTFYCLNNSDHFKEFLEMVNILVTNGLPVLPPDFCTPCEMAKGLNWQEIYVRYSTPLILIFQDGRLTSIVILRCDASTLDKALAHSDDAAKVFLHYHYEDDVLLSEEARIKIEELFRNRIKSQTSFFHIVPLIIAAASVDAINPCEFFVLIVFLSLVTVRLGREAVLKFGVAFSMAIFAAYFMMGLGLWRLIGYVHEAKIFVVILGLSIGLRSILNFILGFFGLSIGLRETLGGFLNKKFKRIPNILSKKTAYRLRRFSSNPSSAFLIGVATSVFLLPCTSGPYLIALSLIADLETQIQGLILLTLYNSIIITPFLAITAGMYMLKIKTRELKKWSSAKQRWLNLAGGLLMMALSIYLITYAI